MYPPAVEITVTPQWQSNGLLKMLKQAERDGRNVDYQYILRRCGPVGGASLGKNSSTQLYKHYITITRKYIVEEWYINPRGSRHQSAYKKAEK